MVTSSPEESAAAAHYQVMCSLLHILCLTCSFLRKLGIGVAGMENEDILNTTMLVSKITHTQHLTSSKQEGMWWHRGPQHRLWNKSLDKRDKQGPPVLPHWRVFALCRHILTIWAGNEMVKKMSGGYSSADLSSLRLNVYWCGFLNGTCYIIFVRYQHSLVFCFQQLPAGVNEQDLWP